MTHEQQQFIDLNRRVKALEGCLNSLIVDVEAMQDRPDEDKEWFGEFEEWTENELGGPCRICWPCLAIHLEEAKKLLRTKN